MNCVFCKIISNKIPSYKVYEDENYLAFLAVPSINPGHTLVIPKKHIRWVWDVENIGEYFQVVKKIANAIRKSMKTEFLASAIVGEEVPHAHVWLVPRYENDGHGGAIQFGNVKEIDESDMKNIAEKIKQKINE